MAPGKLKPDTTDCGDVSETQQKINALKRTYCQDLDTADKAIETGKIGFDANEKLYRSKQRRYLSTKENCDRYINTEISIGSQLIQANEKMKAGVAAFKTTDDSLATQLAAIFQSVKDVKNKTKDLLVSATTLANSKKDSCNATQWTAITGKTEGKDDAKPSDTDPCAEIDDALNNLFNMPDALMADIDLVFKSSSDIIGIQKFCNTAALVGLQGTLYDQAVAFDKMLLANIVLRKKDLDDRLADLKDALAHRTASVMDLYDQRCKRGAIHTTLDKICNSPCDCVADKDDCKPRLEGCAEKICEICGEVKYAFVRKEETPAPAQG